jgi:hypothetical protein
MFDEFGRFRGSSLISVGWLFADMLLVLAMIFLAVNTFLPVKPKVTLTPTPTRHPTHTPTPTPTPNALLLDKQKVRLILTGINPDLLSAGDRGAISDLETKIKDQMTQKGMQNRRAGIAIAYGGADDFSQAERGTLVAAEVYKVLDMLGQQHFVFCGTVHYDPLFTALYPHDTVVIDIYLFNKSVPNCSHFK